MQNINLIALGSLKEKYFREAADEYKKRLGGKCHVSEIELKDEKLPDNPSPSQISAALDREAEKILAAIPSRSYVIAMCVEGVHMTSEEFSSLLDKTATSGYSSVTLIIGSSFGLSDKVKAKADLKLSMSKMTFPHKLARVMLYEAVYRAHEISSGGKYHK
ncbi:MAG: 23S rRNA (pseudouridine(1915)-N(3))-methyltransferase RlmH [Clostridia bacterium]|nr:23S rRNA (pseudouridine(1915)-N(3))-methyltransferase RlmH [Clostridia bacterium]